MKISMRYEYFNFKLEEASAYKKRIKKRQFSKNSIQDFLHFSNITVRAWHSSFINTWALSTSSLCTPLWWRVLIKLRFFFAPSLLKWSTISSSSCTRKTPTHTRNHLFNEYINLIVNKNEANSMSFSSTIKSWSCVVVCHSCWTF